MLKRIRDAESGWTEITKIGLTLMGCDPARAIVEAENADFVTGMMSPSIEETLRARKLAKVSEDVNFAYRIEDTLPFESGTTVNISVWCNMSDLMPTETPAFRKIS